MQKLMHKSYTLYILYKCTVETAGQHPNLLLPNISKHSFLFYFWLLSFLNLKFSTPLIKTGISLLRWISHPSYQFPHFSNFLTNFPPMISFCPPNSFPNICWCSFIIHKIIKWIWFLYLSALFLDDYITFLCPPWYSFLPPISFTFPNYIHCSSINNITYTLN